MKLEHFDARLATNSSSTDYALLILTVSEQSTRKLSYGSRTTSFGIRPGDSSNSQGSCSDNQAGSKTSGGSMS